MATQQQQDMTQEQEQALAAAPTFGVWMEGATEKARAKYPAGLTPAISKGGNVFWQVVGSRARFGVAINPQFPGLPTKLIITMIEQVEVPADPKKPRGARMLVWRKPEGSPDLPITLEKVVVKGEDGKAKAGARFQGKRTLPNGEDRMIHALVTQRVDGLWNLKVACTGVGGEAGPMDDIVFLMDTRI